ncbi:MAG TPA: hypothetical protein VIJ68_00080, partial [Candidatus Saccharimonadales bacterium]
MGFPELIRSIGEDEARERTAGLFGHFGEEFFMVWQQRARRIPVLKAVNDETVSVLQPKLDAELSSQDEQQICALLQGLGLFSIGVATNLEAYPEVLSAALQTDA